MSAPTDNITTQPVDTEPTGQTEGGQQATVAPAPATQPLGTPVATPDCGSGGCINDDPK